MCSLWVFQFTLTAQKQAPTSTHAWMNYHTEKNLYWPFYDAESISPLSKFQPLIRMLGFFLFVDEFLPLKSY